MSFKDLFKKSKKDEVLDLAELQRRGTLKRREEILNNSTDSNSGVLDLTSPLAAPKTEENALGFLGNLASSNTVTKVNPQELSMSEKKAKIKEVLIDLKSHQNKTNDKIYKIFERIDLIEKKIERLERRAGL